MAQTPEPAACDPGAHPPRAPFAPPPREMLESAAAMLRAAGDPACLRLLLRLAEGERCVTELAEAEGDKLATVLSRLQQLHAARLVTRRRKARHIRYALADGHVARLLRDILDHAAEGAPSARSPEGDGS